MTNENQIRLRTILVELYPVEADLRRVAHDAGVALDRVTLGESAVNNWEALLLEAEKNQQVADLLDVAQREYPGNQALVKAQAAFAATLRATLKPPVVALPNNNLHLLNFGRELTPAQRTQIEQRLGERIHRVILLSVKFDDARPFGPQCVALLDEIGWSTQEWETIPFLINPPGYTPAALALISMVHGRRGHFPAMVRICPETVGLQTSYVVAEIVNLQALRNAALGVG